MLLFKNMGFNELSSVQINGDIQINVQMNISDQTTSSGNLIISWTGQKWGSIVVNLEIAKESLKVSSHSISSQNTFFFPENAMSYFYETLEIKSFFNIYQTFLYILESFFIYVSSFLYKLKSSFACF